MNQTINELSRKTVELLQKNNSDRRLARMRSRRKLWLKVHLYLGLSAGAVLLVIGLTGSILTFWLEIDRWLNPELMIVNVPQQAVSRPMADIVFAANTALPPTAKFSYAYPSHKPNQAYYFFYDLPNEDTDKHLSVNVFVNPYTAKVIGTRAFYHASNLFGQQPFGLLSDGLHLEVALCIVGRRNRYVYCRYVGGDFLYFRTDRAYSLVAVDRKMVAGTDY